MKPLERMKKSELIEVLKITARRHENLKAIVDKFQTEEFEKKMRQFCPGPAFKKTATTAQFCLEERNNGTN